MTGEMCFKVSKDCRDILSINYSVLQTEGRPDHFSIILPSIVHEANARQTLIRLFIK